MTPEQQRHEDDYNSARRRYESAFAEKRHAENEINTILNRRNHLMNVINELTAEKKLNEVSFDELSRSAAQNSDFDESIRDTETKLEAASLGFSAIGESSVGIPQKLTDVFHDRDHNSKTSISSAFEKIKNNISYLQNKIDDLKRRISDCEREIEEGRNSERHWRNVAADQDRAMNNASIEMAYHKRCMNN